jgi:hypothetical protein
MEINMLTFVIWIVGILLLLWLFKWTVLLILVAFDKHWFAGLCCLIIGFLGWVGMLMAFL